MSSPPPNHHPIATPRGGYLLGIGVIFECRHPQKGYKCMWLRHCGGQGYPPQMLPLGTDYQIEVDGLVKCRNFFGGGVPLFMSTCACGLRMTNEYWLPVCCTILMRILVVCPLLRTDSRDNLSEHDKADLGKEYR